MVVLFSGLMVIVALYGMIMAMYGMYMGAFSCIVAAVASYASGQYLKRLTGMVTYVKQHD